MFVDLSSPDAELVTLARDGDPDAFRFLFVRHRPAVVAVCRQQLGPAGDVDDAVQETFARALARLDQLRDPATFGAWVRSIATRICVDHHRVASRVTVVQGDLALEVEDASPQPDEVAEAEERSASFRASLQQLGPRDQRALWLRHVTEAPVAVVADELGLTEGSTRVMLARARKRLRAVAGGGIGVLVPWSWRQWLRNLVQTPNPAFDFAAVAVAMTIAATAGAGLGSPVEPPRKPDNPVAQTRSENDGKAAGRQRQHTHTNAKRATGARRTPAATPSRQPAARLQPDEAQRQPTALVDVEKPVHVRRQYPKREETDEIADVTVFSGEEEGNVRFYGDDVMSAAEHAEAALESPLEDGL